MDFLKEVGKLIEEESRKVQSSYEDQQALLKQLSQISTQPAQTPQPQVSQAPAPKPQVTPASTQRMPSSPQKIQPVKTTTVQKRKKPPSPHKEKAEPVKTTTTKRAAPSVPSAAQSAPPVPGRKPLSMKFTRDEVIRGVIISEVLGPPPCKRKKQE
jgi:hypothetical protein